MPLFTQEDIETGNWKNRTEELMAMVNLYHSKNEELKEVKSKGEITCGCQVGDKCEGNFSHPSMVCCSYSNDPQTKVIWDMKKEMDELKKEKEKLFDAWLYYWSAAQLGCEHSIPMSDQEGGKYQLLLDKLGEEELQEENEEQLAAVECLKFMDYTYKDGQWMMDDEDEEEED